MDQDMFPEADLLVEYKAAFGLDNEDAIDAALGHKDPASDRVKALNYLKTVLAVTPTATDRLESWFAKPVTICLRNVGLLTLGDLVRFLNVYGYRWHGRIKVFGVQRADQVANWLSMQYESIHMLLADNASEHKSKRALHLGPSANALPSSAHLSEFGSGTLVQMGLGRIQLNTALTGSAGEFRSHMANTLGASNDLEAINAWLGYYKDKPSSRRSYRQEVERFMLWCVLVLKKAVSSVTGRTRQGPP